MIDYYKLLNIVNELLADSKDLKNASIAQKFEAYNKKIINMMIFIKRTYNDDFIVGSANKILNIDIYKKRSWLRKIIDFLVFLRIRPAYLVDWKNFGRYLYYVEEVELVLSSIKYYLVDEKKI